MMDVTNSTGTVLFYKNEIHAVGKTPPHGELPALLAWLDQQDSETLVIESLPDRYPAAFAWKDVACGMIARPVSFADSSVVSKSNWLLWFRPEVVQTVSWGGDPRKQLNAGMNERLHPRSSFERWCEDVHLKSIPFAQRDVWAATSLAADLVDVVLEIEASRQIREHSRLLDLAHRQLQLVFDATGDGLISVGRDGRLLSERSQAFSSWFPLAAPGAFVWQVLFGENDPRAQEFAALWRQLVSDTIPFEVCVDQMCKELTRGGQCFEIGYKEVREGRALSSILITLENVTERVAARRHLAQMEGRYRGLLEAAPDAMVVVNQAGEIVLLNLQAEKQFGYPRDELIGQQVTNLIPKGFAERLVADGTRSAAEALAQQIGTGIELSARRKDGTEFPIEIMLSPLQSAEGTLVTAAIRDISTRKAAEKRLAQLEGRYRGLLEAAPDSMVLVNKAGEIVLVNRQAENVFGYERAELVGGSVRRLVSAVCSDRLVAFTRRAPDGSYAEQSRTGIELDGLHKDGRMFPIEATLSPLETMDEGILLTVAIRDITTHKQNEARLQQTVTELNRSNEELGNFAYIASHDLQEPLRMVASYTQLLSKRYKGRLDADADEFIAFAVDGANRMQGLIEDLLSYSRVGTTGKQLLDTSSEEALEQALINLSGAIADSSALVTHDPLPAVLADEMQLVQLFQNLVGNAIKYQNPGVPRVHISAAQSPGGRWTFSVRDNGLGIDPQYFDKIFGMFQRLHKRKEFAGTGIGLAMCKKIVERHGGIISVESQPGQGSTFRFALARTERMS